jgi:hypothetical protein
MHRSYWPGCFHGRRREPARCTTSVCRFHQTARCRSMAAAQNNGRVVWVDSGGETEYTSFSLRLPALSGWCHWNVRLMDAGMVSFTRCGLKNRQKPGWRFFTNGLERADPGSGEAGIKVILLNIHRGGTQRLLSAKFPDTCTPASTWLISGRYSRYLDAKQQLGLRTRPLPQRACQSEHDIIANQCGIRSSRNVRLQVLVSSVTRLILQ